MKGLLRYFGNYKREAILAPLFKLLEVLFELFVPLVVASIIDDGLQNGGDISGALFFLSRRCLLLLLLGVVGLLSTLTAQFFSARAAAGFAAGVRRALFEKMTRLSFGQIDAAGESTMINCLTADVEQMQSGVNLTLRLLTRSPFIVVGAMVMAFTIDARAALLFAVTIPLLLATVIGIMGVTVPGYKAVRRGLDQVMLHTKENLEGVRVIRAFVQEKEEGEAFSRKNAALTTLQQKVGRISALLNPFSYVLLNLAVIFLLRQSGARVDAGELSQGQVVALYNYMSQILVEVIKLANLVITVTKSLACAARVNAVLALPDERSGEKTLPEGARAPSPSAVEEKRTPVIALRGAGLRYHAGAAPALLPLDLEVRQGEFVGILGPTGAGKSTLLRMLAGLYLPSEGEAEIFGRNLREWDPRTLLQRVGFVPQKAELFSGTIRENLRMGAPAAEEDTLWEAIRAAGAEDVVLSKGGLDGRLSQGGANLSGGQRQRLAIAMALVKRPALLLLDDSLSALDYRTERQVRQALLTLPYRPTVLLVSQRPAGLVNADRILVLEDGNLRGEGVHARLLDTCPLYRDIWESTTVDSTIVESSMADDRKEAE